MDKLYIFVKICVTIPILSSKNININQSSTIYGNIKKNKILNICFKSKLNYIKCYYYRKNNIKNFILFFY